jgi:hypothetical protein
MDLKVHHDVPMNGPKGPSCVWSKAPIWCKKYPAVAGYFMKMEQSSTKRMAKRRGPFAKNPPEKDILDSKKGGPFNWTSLECSEKTRD